MFRKFLEPKIERRIKSLNELHKYLDERWLARSAEKEMAGKIEQTAFHQTFYQKFSPQNTNLMNSTPRSTRFTAMSMKKINYYTRSRSKVLKRLSTEWPRRIVSKIGYNHLLLQKRMSWRWVEEQRGGNPITNAIWFREHKHCWNNIFRRKIPDRRQYQLTWVELQWLATSAL